jgi:predicted neutral ceramidase superfamily lipid hydrolase
MPENLPLFYDNIYKALNVLVSLCGGSKEIASKLWPTKKDAEKWLSDCLNPDRSAKLDPEEFMALLRLARERGFHGVMEYIATDSGYARPVPVEPEDETNELRREVRDLLQAANERLERIERAERKVRVKAAG